MTVTWPSDINAVSVTSEIDFRPLIVVSLGSAGSCVVVVDDVDDDDVDDDDVNDVDDVDDVDDVVDVVVVEGATGVAVPEAVDAFEVPTTFVAVTVKV